MEVTAWLEDALSRSEMTPEARDYLMGRGATPDVIARWGIKVFSCPPTPCPDADLARRYKPHFEAFDGRMVFPLRSPRGILLGLDSRPVDRKEEMRLILPESKWNPVWIGMPSAMDAIWDRTDLVVVEGRYDVYAMYHVAKTHAVLGSGPAHLTWMHIEFIRRWVRPTSRVFMGYDRDAAGRRGTVEALKQLHRLGIPSFDLTYGVSGDDPGLIWDRGGVEALRDAFPEL